MRFLVALVAAAAPRAWAGHDVEHIVSSAVVFDNIDPDLFNEDKLADVEFCEGVIGEIINVHALFFSHVHASWVEGSARGGNPRSVEISYAVVTDKKARELKEVLKHSVESGQMDALLNAQISAVLSKARVNKELSLAFIDARTVDGKTIVDRDGGGSKKDKASMIGLIMGLMFLGLALVAGFLACWTRQRRSKRPQSSQIVRSFGSGAMTRADDEPDVEFEFQSRKPYADTLTTAEAQMRATIASPREDRGGALDNGPVSHDL